MLWLLVRRFYEEGRISDLTTSPCFRACCGQSEQKQLFKYLETSQLLFYFGIWISNAAVEYECVAPCLHLNVQEKIRLGL
jgi:hypothetical protein